MVGAEKAGSGEGEADRLGVEVGGNWHCLGKEAGSESQGGKWATRVGSLWVVGRD